MEAFLEEFQHLKIQLDAIKLATTNFANNNVIGKGGFGEVYKGVLSHCKGQNIVALKRLDRRYGQGDSEFWKEVLMLSRYTHENIISLLGFCDEDGEKILVYEHASHGSLDCHLSSTTLTWRQRLKICLGAAKGLSYLHDAKGTQQRVLHRDIKSSNILLDENWNAKVSDMGLSKVGPANQKHTFLVSNVVGTPGYIDPLYMETYSLTKESDVYSFGVVLFEVLCGSLCFEYNSGHFESLVPMWKRSHDQKKIDEIIFKHMKQHIDPRSLKTFSVIAYRCLQKSREERPQMSQVVEQLEIALRFQEKASDYEEMIKTAVPPLVYESNEELKMLLSKGIFVNMGKTWFLLNKNGEHCEMISATECLIPIRFAFPCYLHYGRKKSRFDLEKLQPLCREFKTHVRTQFLTPHITYTVNLVFQFEHTCTPDYLGFNYTLAGDTKSLTSYLVDKREDGWLMAGLYQFTSDSRNIDLEITFQCQNPLMVEGIEFQPLKRVSQQIAVEEEGIEDEDVDMQRISPTDIYWLQKLPSDVEDMINWSQDSVQWTTTKELYLVLCKGFPINDGEEWFSLAKDGNKFYMLPARVALKKQEWKWGSLPESRFGEVAFDPHGSFSIYCISRMLSPQTTYASYLVYKLQENHPAFEFPVKVSDGDHTWYIYLLTLEFPIIRGKVTQNAHKPLSRRKMKGIPQKRNDGWMEVQVWEFQTGTTSEMILKDHRLTLMDTESLEGLIVQGIEFKPILE